MIKELYIKFIKQNKTYFLLYLVTLLYIPINKILIPKYYGSLISNLERKNFKDIKGIFIYLIGGWLITQLLNTSSSYITTILMPKFKQYVRKFLVSEIFSRYKTNYEDLKMGEVITKIIKTPYILEDVFWLVKDFLIKNIFIIISLFGYLTYYQPKLGGLFLISMLLIVMVTCKYYKTCIKLYSDIEIHYDKTHEEIEDIMSNLISIFNSRRTKFEKKRIENVDNLVYKGNEKLNKCRNRYRIIYTLLFMIIIVGLNYYSYTSFRNKEIDLKTFISIFIINYSLLDIFMGFYHEINDYMMTQSSINLLINYLKKELPKKTKTSKLMIPKTYKNQQHIYIEFKNVNFKYPSATKYSLKNINITISPNENIVIMGNIGSGKSTFSKLILRFLNNYDGDILINGKSNKILNIEDIRSKIVYIPQHPNLFNRTLKENLLYGLEKNVTVDKIFKKMDEIGLTDLKEIFKSQLNQSVGKLGSNLSGGQRQIVWLLRSMFYPSKVLILDEPTSSLDSKTKDKIIKLIKSLGSNRTVIIITHDKTILNAGFHDKLINFKNGKIDRVVKNIK
jgi:ABC-type multidrug transport system fused ATPase/permease subunit